MEDRSSMDAIVTRVRFVVKLQYGTRSVDLRIGDPVRLCWEGNFKRTVRYFSRAGVFVSGVPVSQPWYSVVRFEP